jgi:hypothetical protein
MPLPTAVRRPDALAYLQLEGDFRCVPRIQNNLDVGTNASLVFISPSCAAMSSSVRSTPSLQFHLKG